MRGSINVIVQNDRTKYEFTLRRNITIVKGDSATGKTTLIEMIRDFNLLGNESGVELKCMQRCVVLEGNSWEEQLKNYEHSVVFVDEGNRFVSSKEFASTIQKTDNYYVLITRESLDTLPYSVEEIYGIRTNRKFGGLAPAYHEIFRIYSMEKRTEIIEPDLIVTEDSNSGFQFFTAVCEKQGMACYSADGKSNIEKMMLQYTNKKILVIADGAAFGSEIEKVLKTMQFFPSVSLYLPESFEWLILMSGCIDDKEVREMSLDWGKYIESEQFFSWEQFFTKQLVEKSEGTYLQYSKKKLNENYLKENIISKILRQINIKSLQLEE